MTIAPRPSAGRLAIVGTWLGLVSIGFGVEVPAGEIVDGIKCEASPAHSYAVFLPDNYDSAQAWPVVFCFDPRGWGSRPVGVFREAAEKLGCIVAGSNDSRNGPVQAAAIEAMITDVRRRWNIDPQRVYVAGFSGGARVATRLAFAGLAQAVVACGAGLPFGTVSHQVRFDFFGAAGFEDFNREEMERLDRELASCGVAHRLELFHGGHEWMPPSVAVRAVAWLEEQHKHAAIRARYAAIVELARQRQSAALDGMPPEEAWRECGRLIVDYADMLDVSEFKRRSRELQRLSAVRGELSQLRAAVEHYRQAQTTLLRCIREGDAAAVRQLIHTWQTGGVPADPASTGRVWEGALTSILAGARDGFARNDYASATVWLVAATAIVPDNAMFRYDLASAHALAGNADAAIVTLEEAVAIGFNDPVRLERDGAWNLLRGDPAFMRILNLLHAPD